MGKRQAGAQPKRGIFFFSSGCLNCSLEDSLRLVASLNIPHVAHGASWGILQYTSLFKRLNLAFVFSHRPGASVPPLGPASTSWNAFRSSLNICQANLVMFLLLPARWELNEHSGRQAADYVVLRSNS